MEVEGKKKRRNCASPNISNLITSKDKEGRNSKLIGEKAGITLWKSPKKVQKDLLKLGKAQLFHHERRKKLPKKKKYKCETKKKGVSETRSKQVIRERSTGTLHNQLCYLLHVQSSQSISKGSVRPTWG